MESTLVAAAAAAAAAAAVESESPIPISAELALAEGRAGSRNNSKSWTPRFLSPAAATPVKRVFVNLRDYLEEIGHLTKLNPQDSWLPITESRSGNAHYAAFHTLTAGIGFQALLLPVAFSFLGWGWGVVSLAIAYLWQLYTLWILVRLHEAVPGKRYNRYVELAQAAFGERLGLWLAVFPTVYLSGGTATALILVGGETMKLFFRTVCGAGCSSDPLTTLEWYLVFTSLCIVLAQLPNLNSIAGLSLVGAVTAVTFTTMSWVLSVSYPHPSSISYQPIHHSSPLLSVLNALGIIAFAFRGHNLSLEIQATMPSTFKHPAHEPMWKGVKVAYVIVALCLFPLAIAGFFSYGNLMPAGGILSALYEFHAEEAPRAVMAITFLLVVLSCLCSFQIYSMPVFDSFEAAVTSRTRRPCPPWLRSAFRVLYAFVSLLAGAALPFLSSLAALLGGLTLPVTFSYPCIMWALLTKPPRLSFSWFLHWFLGSVGLLFSLAFSAAGLCTLLSTRLHLGFFRTP